MIAKPALNAKRKESRKDGNKKKNTDEARHAQQEEHVPADVCTWLPFFNVDLYLAAFY